MRCRRTLILVIFCIVASFIFYNTFHRRNEDAQPNSKSAKRKSNLSVLEKSVYLRYGDTDPLVVFSAYLQSPSIFVILASYGYFLRRVHCRYFDENRNEIGEPTSVTVFPEFIVKCVEIPGAHFVGISVDKRDKVDLANLVRITTKERDFSYEFSVCLAPIYGKEPKWLMLVEFFEFYKLQGVDHFYAYHLDSDSELTNKVLSNYQSDKIVEIIAIKNFTGCLNRHRCRHEVQLQDCLIRSRFHSKFVATVDLDERITPTGVLTLKDYIRAHHSSGIGEFRFRCRWVLRYHDIPQNLPSLWTKEELPTLLWHNTSHVAPLNHTTKSIIDPNTVKSMGVHQVLRFAPGKDVFLVPPEDAVVRHYRLQKGWSFFLKEAEGFGAFEDTSLESNLQAALTKNVRKKLCSIWERFC